MLSLSSEKILLIGDGDRALQSAITQIVPTAQLVAVPTVFDALAELSSSNFSAIFAPVEPIERRPEAAVRALRDLAGDTRVMLFGHPTLEPLSRKMLAFGADDYVVTPVSSSELHQLFGQPPLRLAAQSASTTDEQREAPIDALGTLPLAEIMLDAIIQHPTDAIGAAIRYINSRIGPKVHLTYSPTSAAAPKSEDHRAIISQPVRQDAAHVANLHLMLPVEEAENAPRHALSQLAQLIARLSTVQQRHLQMQKSLITDDLTGVYNGRYFRHFLAKITEKALQMKFPVTLLLFDIDNFKRYNDMYGHGVGDEILRQTARLIRRSCREHDLVARISGDEFAVVFWEKEGPRQPREPKAAAPGRLPHSPSAVFERLRRLLASSEFTALGGTGKGILTISGGLAVFPYEATTPESLYELADKRLMFGAKKFGKDSLYLVGAQEDLAPPTSEEP